MIVFVVISELCKSMYEELCKSMYENEKYLCKFQRIFEVPAFTEDQKKIPFARVNHNKYMVTDKTAYIGMCSWRGFMPPRSKIGGHIVFVLSVILSFCPPL